MCTRHEILLNIVALLTEKIVIFFLENFKSLKSKNAQRNQCSSIDFLSPLEIFTIKMGTPCICQTDFGITGIFETMTVNEKETVILITFKCDKFYTIFILKF